MSWKTKLWNYGVILLFVSILFRGFIGVVSMMGLYEGVYWETTSCELRGDNGAYRVELDRLIARKCVRRGYEYLVISQMIRIVPKTQLEQAIVAQDLNGKGDWKLVSYNSTPLANTRSKSPAIDGAILSKKLIYLAMRNMPVNKGAES